ncbi:MAG: HEAT repeat domain-containing protein [Planctomycetota bacterium]|nr:HEAT repeat domain-containing protein [Planctomycetota bacterium]
MTSPRSLLLTAPCLIVLGLLASASARGQEVDEPITIEILKERAARAVQRRDVDAAKAVILQTGDIETKEAAELALRIVKKMNFDGKLSDAAMRTIEEMNSSDVREWVFGEVDGSMDWRLRLILLEVVGSSKDEKAYPIIISALDDKEEMFQAAAAQLLGNRGDRRAIEPLIRLMVKLDRRMGIVWEQCQASLVKLTGQELDLGVDFETWWIAHGDGVKKEPEPRTPPDPVEGEPIGRVEKGKHDREATFFGLKITCQKIVFIIDVSGSMQRKDPPPAEDQRTGTNRRPAPEPGEERRRILRAQKELKRTIRLLDPAVEFNIIAYSDEAIHWSRRGLRKATKDSKAKAIKFVGRFKADGTTWTDVALEEAYQSNGDAYCFYLLSDGTPTHEGGEEPGDTEAIIENIYEMIPELDIFRRVRIHTLGFRGANEKFMRKLSEMTGGSYRDIR